MAKTIVDTTGDYIDEAARKASQFSSPVAQAVEDGIDAAKRAAKEGREAVNDFVGDATKRVKRRPVESVLISLAVGVVLGFLIAWTTKDA
jgi:ElaB/YqjD/DUF883 family membrane-anchored ribosome-binding protein